MTLALDELTKPHVKRWTKEEYNDLVERGFLSKQRTFLFRGALVDKSCEGKLLVKHWSKAEFLENVERGFLQRERVMLYRGELIEMPPMGAMHARALANVSRLIYQRMLPEYAVRVQMPFDGPGDSMPEPDIAVYTLEADSRLPHPNSAVLIVEVSDSSLSFDRNKALEYAAAGVLEYWIDDVVSRRVEVFREPVPDASTILGFRYASHQILAAGDSIVPLANPSVTFAVADLLP